MNEFIGKLRPSLLVLAAMLVILAMVALNHLFGFMTSLVGIIADDDPQVKAFLEGLQLGMFLAAIIGIVMAVVGAIGSSMGAILHNDPPPQVPASTMEKALEIIEKQGR